MHWIDLRQLRLSNAAARQAKETSNDKHHLPFQFSDLGESEIRLLRLHRGSGSKSIHVTLHHHNLDDVPRFCALSYCWGHSPMMEEVPCEDGNSAGLLSVTSSLYHILISIHVHKLSDGMPLWVDQICIDQSRNTERSHQVQLMARIYGAAKKTLISLDHGTSEDGEAIKLWKLLKNAQRSYRSRMQYKRVTAKIEGTGDPVRKALASVLHHPWFDRLWVVQEVVLSRDRFFMFCGNVIPWKDFLAVTGFTARSQLCMSWANDFRNHLNITDQKLEILDHFVKNFPAENSRGMELCWVLDSFSTRSASDPHDKIFALLGLARGVDGLIEQIDYAEPYHLTFARAAHLMIEQATQQTELPNLGVLAFVDPATSHHRQHGASWVPDFHYDHHSTCRSSNQVTDSIQCQNEIAEVQWAASDQSDEMFKLRVRAVYIDTISEPTFPPSEANYLQAPDSEAPDTLGFTGCLLDRKIRTTWVTRQGSIVTTHVVCRPGDSVYVLDGLDTPCVLRKLGVGQCAFMGLVHTQICRSIHPEDVSMAYRLHKDDTHAEIVLRTKYADPDMAAVRRWRNTYWRPWLRRECKDYPFVTENLVLV